jgi:hypothetical protein
LKKQITFSFIINIAGLFSLFFVDLQMAKMNDDLLISSWALTKSILFIGLIFVLLGLDQALIRMKLNLKKIIFPATVQFLVLIGFITFFVSIIGTKIETFPIVLSLFILAMLYLFYAEHRLNMNYIKAQYCVNGWKIIFLCLILLFGYYEYAWILPLSMFLAFVVIFFNRGLFTIFNLVSFQKYKNILTTGLHYFIALLTLTLTIYIDQVLLSADGKITESSILFSHITFFVSPNAILLGFGGFLLVPYLKKQPENKASIFKKYIWIFILIVLAIVIVTYFLGFVLFSYLKPDQSPSIFLAIGLSVIAFLRYLYILPSSYIGSFATNKLIRKVSVINVAGIAIYLIVYFTLSRYMEDYLLAIYSAIFIVWMIRIINGYFAIFEIIGKNE